MGKTAKKKATSNLRSTGIDTLDEVLAGGIPARSTILLTGNAGSGKTILAEQWLYAGVKKYGESGVYVALTESVETLRTNLGNMDFYDESVTTNDLHFTDLRAIAKGLNLQDKLKLTPEDLSLVVDTVTGLVEKLGAKRVVVDSINALVWPLKDEGMIRAFISQLSEKLRQAGVITVLISEAAENHYSTYGVEEFVSDGIIRLNYLPGEQGSIRRMEIIKMRGTTFRSGPVIFEITSGGLHIFPKLPIDRSVAKTEFSIRHTTGNKELDKMTNGGIPEGHVILLTGNTGSGKTTFGMEFIRHGLEIGESGVYVALEESISQVKKTALEHGWDLEKYEKSGQLAFVNPSLIDINPDKLLYDVMHSVEKTGAKRIVIDSVSSLETATLDKDALREFLIQLTVYLKTVGVTAYLTYLNNQLFSANSGNLIGGGASSELRLSSVVDGIFMLRYVERDQTVKKLLNILKMRGSQHDKQIREFEVTKPGIKIGKVFKA